MSSGTTFDECSTYILTNMLEISAWKQNKDKITIHLKGGKAGGAAAAGGAEKEPGVPLSESTADAKTKLNQFCQKKCKSLITKTDVVYTTEQVASEDGSPAFQSSVCLNCLEGISFAGGVESDRKAAEKSAASEALSHYETDEAMLATAAKKRKVEKAPAENAPAKVVPAGGPVILPKSELNMAIGKLLKKILSKADVVYETEKVEGVGFQSTVKLPCLNAEWSSMSWTGEASSKKTDAEHSAAGVACAALKEYKP